MSDIATRRIGFVAALGGYAWGGSEDLWAGAAIKLARGERPVFASVAARSSWPRQLSAVAEAGVDVVERRATLVDRIVDRVRGPRCRPGHWHVTPSFSKWIHRVKPDLVCVSHGGYKDGIRWMEQLHAIGVPYASIVQSMSPHLWPTDAENESLRLLYGGAKAVYCVSKANLALLQDQLGMALPQARVVWNPYNVPRSLALPWPSPTDIWRLACVARLDPDSKGQDLLFSVLARPEWRQRPVRVSLFGGGRSPENVRRLALMRGVTDIVDFRDSVGDVTEIWRTHHALVLPSRYEGLPLALVEAMLMARPAIVTDVAGNAEVAADGETGFVAAAPHVKLFSEAMERAWSQRERWEAMGQLARRRALDLLPEQPCEVFADELLQACDQ